MFKVKNVSNENIKYDLLGIGIIALSLIMLISVAAPNSHPIFPGDGVGAIGSFFDRVLRSVTGAGKYLLPFVLGIWGLRLLLGKRYLVLNNCLPGTIILSLTVLTTIHLRIPVEHWTLEAGWAGNGGGVIGAALVLVFTYLFGFKGTVIILATLYFASLVLITKISVVNILAGCFIWLKDRYELAKDKLIQFIYIPEEHIKDDIMLVKPEMDFELMMEKNENNEMKNLAKPKKNKEFKEISATNEPVKDFLDVIRDKSNQDFVLPPLSILQRNIQLKSMRIEKDITEKVKLLDETLASFGIMAKVTQVSKGPAITRFEMQPAPGVKVSKIVNLADDIALALAASSVRIEAPIPGKAAVGIEIPNKEIGIVTFREVIETGDFQQVIAKLSIALGKDIAGNPVIADLQSMPHLLIAGATGSGKSVCMNTVIASLLYKATPDELKLLMIDPKMVELINYNGIPHLISPVVTNSKKAAVSLKWVVEEMENRYELFAKNGVKDLTRYNKLKSSSGKLEDKELPYIVVLIDELADLMMVAPVEVEDAICRLAQMARAAGIHLVVATQRPSVDVITGLIKANIPSRIAFAVSSQTDSRTILDMGGAEKLLGRGDMLYYPIGAAKPLRVQGCFLSDKEVDDIVTFLKHQGQPEYQQGIMESQAGVIKNIAKDEDDPLFFEAARLVIEQGQASISMVQRRLHIGYNRAARLIDLLEERNIIGSYEGNKPRNILISVEDLEPMEKQVTNFQEEIQ